MLAAQGLRAQGITQRELDLMYKVNPAKLSWVWCRRKT